MAAQRKHKKIDRTGVLPRQLTGIVKLLAFLLCLFAPIRLVNALGDEGCADFFGALEGCFVLFSLFGIGMNRAVSNLIRTRIERYGITGAKKIAGQALLTAFFVSVVLALLGAALKDVLFGSFYALPFAKMAFLALLCALVILTLFWMLLGILDAFGRRETAGRWILAFGVLLFFAAPLIAAPLDAYGQKVGALLQNTSYQAAYGAFGAAFSVLCVSLLCTAGCGISWIKASHELHQAEYGSSTNPAADRSITFALLRNGLVICVPAALAGIGRIGQSSIYLKNGSVSTWGAYLGKYRLLMTLALLGAFALAASLLPQFQLVLKRRSLRKSREKCMVAFRCTALYTIPCAVLFLTTAQPMLHMLFSKGELNGLDSILKVLAITVIFYGLAFMLGSVLFAAELYYSIWIASAGFRPGSAGQFFRDEFRAETRPVCGRLFRCAVCICFVSDSAGHGAPAVKNSSQLAPCFFGASFGRHSDGACLPAVQPGDFEKCCQPGSDARFGGCRTARLFCVYRRFKGCDQTRTELLCSGRCANRACQYDAAAVMVTA